jgi:hypothetical protein
MEETRGVTGKVSDTLGSNTSIKVPDVNGAAKEVSEDLEKIQESQYEDSTQKVTIITSLSLLRVRYYNGNSTLLSSTCSRNQLASYFLLFIAGDAGT